MSNTLDHIVVVGGGSAGWASALLINKLFPSSKVTLIESLEIGILGAGEGSTPQLISFFDDIGIPVSDLVKETKATIKNGIKFTNWNNDGSYYFHSFATTHSRLDNINAFDCANNYHLGTVMAVSNNSPCSEFDFLSVISESNRVPFLYNGETNPSINPILNFTGLGTFSIHFDATLLAQYMKKIGKERGVECIENTIVDVTTNVVGDVTGLTLSDGQIVFPDFVIDCSGFKRLIIGKVYNSHWDSYNDYLPADSALPFFLPIDEEIPPYTESIAMKYGWMWKIPLQHRYGCGYVYDSTLITEEEARIELESYLGFEPEYPRKDKGGFKFEAGCYATPWVNNCIAIGLSAGFIEPLEATAIFSALDSLRKALYDPSLLINRSPVAIERYNKETTNYLKDISYFIYFHYMSQRNDTDFWTRFKEEDRIPKEVKRVLNNWKMFVPRYQDFPNHTPFQYINWLPVGYGTGQLNTELFQKTAELNKYQDNFGSEWKRFKEERSEIALQCINHQSFLRKLKNETK
jgi:tryptophan halogenase